MCKTKLGCMISNQGHTIEDVAIHLQVTAETIWQWVQGRRTPQNKVYKEIAKYLGCKVEDLRGNAYE